MWLQDSKSGGGHSKNGTAGSRKPGSSFRFESSNLPHCLTGSMAHRRGEVASWGLHESNYLLNVQFNFFCSIYQWCSLILSGLNAAWRQVTPRMWASYLNPVSHVTHNKNWAVQTAIAIRDPAKQCKCQFESDAMPT